MDTKYLVKILLLVVLAGGSIYYFVTNPVSEVSFRTFFILALTLLLAYDEIKRSNKKSAARKFYQVVVDRGLLLVFGVLSVDIIYSMVVNGLSMTF